jgi:hypothetical protein
LANLAIRTPLLPCIPPPGDPVSGILLVPLDLADRTGCRLVRVLAELAAGPPLPQQIPALVERFFGGPQPLMLLRAAQLARGELLTERVLGLDEVPDLTQDLLVVHAPTVKPWPSCCGPGSGY